MTSARLTGPVQIIGAGLLGTSIGLALSRLGLRVSISDLSSASQSLAQDMGAGTAGKSAEAVQLVVVCVPPDSSARVIAEQLDQHPNATVTDVASVKAQILDDLVEMGADLTRYVGSHPMAGRERGGALAARGDLFAGRPWVIAASDQSSSAAVQTVEALALDLGGVLFHFDPEEHDRAVGLVSHVPQVISSLLAAQLNSASAEHLSLAGQGLRDTTRIAASDSKLWLQILQGNSIAVLNVLKSFRVELDSLMEALANPNAAGALTKIGKILELGNSGVAKIPGKHGAKSDDYARVIVMIDDRPGELARLLTEVGEAGINLEDLRLEHVPGALVGLPELFVAQEAEQPLISALQSRGWKLAG